MCFWTGNSFWWKLPDERIPHTCRQSPGSCMLSSGHWQSFQDSPHCLWSILEVLLVLVVMYMRSKGGDWAMHILSQNHCNHPGRNELRESKGTPTAFSELMVPKDLEFPRSLLLGEGNGWSLVPARISQKEISHNSDNLSEYFARDTGAEAMMMTRTTSWSELLSYVHLVLKAKPHIRTGKMDLGKGINVVPLFLFLMWPRRWNHCSFLLLVGFILMRISDQTWVVREARAYSVTLHKSTKTHMTMPGCGEKPWENVYCWYGHSLVKGQYIRPL